MSPKIPYELARVRQQKELAFNTYVVAVDNKADIKTLERLYGVFEAFETVEKFYYARWQELGGTSDITELFNPCTPEELADEDWKDEQQTRESVFPY